MIEELEAIGLTNGEARVYEALCELGLSTVGPICDVSKVHRSIIYQILEKLLDKGIISTIVESKTKKYQAAPPTMLLHYVDEEKADLEKKKNDLSKIIPSILQLQAMEHRSAATLYSGFQGILTATFNILESLKAGESYYMVHLPASQPSYHHAMWEKFQRIREEKKILGKQLYDVEVSQEVLDARNAHEGIEARRMPINFNTPPTYYFVYKDTVVISLSQGVTPLAVEIVNQEIADGFIAYCEWLWKESKKM
jgi:sugar-specific transcriptional regulator TrmB